MNLLGITVLLLPITVLGMFTSFWVKAYTGLLRMFSPLLSLLMTRHTGKLGIDYEACVRPFVRCVEQGNPVLKAR